MGIKTKVTTELSAKRLKGQGLKICLKVVFFTFPNEHLYIVIVW